MKEVSSIWYHILKFKWTNTINQMNKSNISNEQIQRLHCRFLVYKWNPFSWAIMFKWTNSIVLINKSKGRLCVITPSVQKVASIWWSSIYSNHLYKLYLVYKKWLPNVKSIMFSMSSNNWYKLYCSNTLCTKSGFQKGFPNVKAIMFSMSSDYWYKLYCSNT